MLGLRGGSSLGFCFLTQRDLSSGLLGLLGGDGDVGGGVLLEEGDEALERAVTLVVNPLLGAGGLELEGREAGDTEGNGRREVVLGDIELGTKGKKG